MAFKYDNASYLLGTAGLNLLTADVRAMLVGADYAATAADLHVSDIPGDAIIVRDIALTSRALAKGIFSGLIPQFMSLLSAQTVVAVVFYSATGDDSTSPLIYYSDDGLGFPFTADGFNYYITYPQSNKGWFQI